jgi:hypothetical protein
MLPHQIVIVSGAVVIEATFRVELPGRVQSRIHGLCCQVTLTAYVTFDGTSLLRGLSYLARVK